MKRAVIVAALIICMPYSAFAVPFDAIVPSVAQIDTSGGSISTASWGWIAATTAAISSTDLMNASLTASISDPLVTILSQSFTSFPSLSQGQVAGLSDSSNTAYNAFLMAGETQVDPNAGFWFLEFQFPDNHTSTATLTASVTMGSDVLNYTSDLMFGSFSSGFLVTQGQRLGSTPVGPAPIPEPGTLLLIGSGLVGLGVGAWRRKKS